MRSEGLMDIVLAHAYGQWAALLFSYRPIGNWLSMVLIVDVIRVYLTFFSEL